MTLDRTGEPVDDEPCGCDHGWIDPDAERPVPCIVCRPHLAPAQRRRLAHGIHDQPHTNEEPS